MPAGHWNWTTPDPLLLLMADLQRTKKCSLSILLHKRLPHLPPKNISQVLIQQGFQPSKLCFCSQPLLNLFWKFCSLAANRREGRSPRAVRLTQLCLADAKKLPLKVSREQKDTTRYSESRNNVCEEDSAAHNLPTARRFKINFCMQHYHLIFKPFYNSI